MTTPGRSSFSRSSSGTSRSRRRSPRRRRSTTPPRSPVAFKPRPAARPRSARPVAGRIVAPRGGIPFPGTEVTRNKLLATIAPTPSSPEAATRARLAVAEAEARASAAQKALERAERLIADEAISVRELESARREAAVAAEAVRAARSAAALYSGAAAAGGRGTWRVVAPISGVLDAVMASPGKTVAPGTPLFRIVDSSELWLVARVPEQEAARLRVDLDAAYQGRRARGRGRRSPSPVKAPTRRWSRSARPSTRARGPSR